MLDLGRVVRGTRAHVLRLVPSGPPLPAGLSGSDLSVPVTDVGIDSRQVVAGSLFVALPGEQTDGHMYAGAALRQGALAVLVSHVPEDLPAPVGTQYVLVVDSPLLALQRLAAAWMREIGPEVVGITGSIGKTTTREIVSAVLSAEYSVLQSAANLNSEIGLPLTVLRLRPEHRVAVLEMGMYGPGEISLLAEIAGPQIGLVTTVAPIHLERLGSIEAIARAKSELVAALPPDGLAVLNADNRWTRAMAVTSGVAPSVLCGFASDAEYRADEVSPRGLEGVRWTLVADGARHTIQTRVPGVHTLHAFLMAVAVGDRLGIRRSSLLAGMEAATLDARQRIARTASGALLIDDSYNAAPMSMNAALELLRHSPGRHLAILGDMLELGPGEEEAHREVGRRAGEVADWVVTRGERASWIAATLCDLGMADRVREAASNGDAIHLARTIMATHPDSAWSILVKGSRGMHMEEVVAALERAT